MIQTIQIMVLFAVAISLSGCATGPLRRSTMGQYGYATVDWTQRAQPAIKPAAIVGGVVVDTAIVAGDTLFVPIAAVPVTAMLSFWGGCPKPLDVQNHPVQDTIGRPLLFPIVFPMWYPISLFALSYGGGLGPVETEKEGRTAPPAVTEPASERAGPVR